MSLGRRAAHLLPALCLAVGGCATMMDLGPGNAVSAERQKLDAGGIDTALASLRPLVAGKKVAVTVSGTASPSALYVRDCLREMAASEGRYVDEGGDIRLDVLAVAEGGGITERNFTLAVNAYTRIPMYYSERFEGVTRIAIRAFDAAGAEIPLATRESGGSAANVYLLRAIGPMPGMR